MSKVINFPGTEDYHDIDPKELVDKVMANHQFDQIFIIGWSDADGMTVSSSASSVPEMIYAFELAKKAILDATTS